jgi:hypothetical protein
LIISGIFPARHPDWKGQEVQVQERPAVRDHLHKQAILPVLQVKLATIVTRLASPSLRKCQVIYVMLCPNVNTSLEFFQTNGTNGIISSSFRNNTCDVYYI